MAHRETDEEFIERVCRSKSAYQYRENAMAAKGSLKVKKEKRGKKWDDAALNPYLCQFCNKWHLGRAFKTRNQGGSFEVAS